MTARISGGNASTPLMTARSARQPSCTKRQSMVSIVRRLPLFRRRGCLEVSRLDFNAIGSL